MVNLYHVANCAIIVVTKKKNCAIMVSYVVELTIILTVI